MLTRIIDEVSTADDDAQHPPVFARLGVLDVTSDSGEIHRETGKYEAGPKPRPYRSLGTSS
jgi:hypothetical protein